MLTGAESLSGMMHFSFPSTKIAISLIIFFIFPLPLYPIDKLIHLTIVFCQFVDCFPCLVYFLLQFQKLIVTSVSHISPSSHYYWSNRASIFTFILVPPVYKTFIAIFFSVNNSYIKCFLAE